MFALSDWDNARLRRLLRHVCHREVATVSSEDNRVGEDDLEVDGNPDEAVGGSGSSGVLCEDVGDDELPRDGSKSGKQLRIVQNARLVKEARNVYLLRNDGSIRRSANELITAKPILDGSHGRAKGGRIGRNRDTNHGRVGVASSAGELRLDASADGKALAVELHVLVVADGVGSGVNVKAAVQVVVRLCVTASGGCQSEDLSET